MIKSRPNCANSPHDVPSPPGARSLVPALTRGLLGRCPQCGRGSLLHGYIAPVQRCHACGENLAPYGTADFAPYLVVFVVGLLFTPIVVALSLSGATSEYAPYAIGAFAVLTALLLLPRAKGLAIALLWALDIRSNQ